MKWDRGGIAWLVFFIMCMAVAIAAFVVFWNLSHDIAEPVWVPVSTADIDWREGQGVGDLWGDDSKKFRTSIFVGTGGIASLGTPYEVTGTYLRVEGSTDKVLTVIIPSTGKPVPNTDPVPVGTGAITVTPPPAMRIGLSSLLRGESTLGMTAAAFPHANGDPPIICDLNAAQRAYIWQNGIPPALVQAFVDAASRANWHPLPPVNGAGPTQPQIIIDPTPYFPELADSP